MVSERFPQFDCTENISSSGSMDCFNNGNNNYDTMAMFNPARRMSGPISRKSFNQIAHNMPRRCSVQNDGSQYAPNPASNLNFHDSQSRFHCIQKLPPLQNFLSSNPQSIDCSRLLPRPSIVQCGSLESVDTSSAVEAARYKTELCRPFEETGQCRYGGKCQFAHGMPELRSLNRHPKYKTELCRTFHTTGFCSYGQRCNFIHNDEERRGPAQSSASTTSRSKPSTTMALPIGASTVGGSSTSSVSSGSPSQSPNYLQEETFARLSPAPSYGSDGGSVASSLSPPGSPKHEMIPDFQFSSTLDMGFSLSQFMKLAV